MEVKTLVEISTDGAAAMAGGFVRLFEGASFFPDGRTSQSTGGSSVFIDFGHCLQ
jgi:hypothetical protein